MRAVIDFREKPSGLIDVMIERGIEVKVGHLRHGDIVIDGTIIVERKTAADLVVSIIDGRLFRQAARLKRNCERPVLLIEGNPYRTGSKLTPSAIRGALVNIQILWNIPVFCARSMADAVEVMQVIACQFAKTEALMPLRPGYRPRRLATRQLHVLQGFPGVGPYLAKRLLIHFGSVAAVLEASADSLTAVRGIGQRTAEGIRELLDAQWHPR
jgi:Fanconi anemia group M protein